ncbi:MAG: DUF883 domain-containing protein [Deferribacteres bacterium]|nr:DUF883 domain-containing protein [candidate division KSB1 bacterium]MCB9503698.1 DUF883 domain-containing protein [Deferribacteres bacterium]
MAVKKNTVESDNDSKTNAQAKTREEYLKKLNALIEEAEAKLGDTLGELSKKAEEIKGVAEYQMKESLEEAEEHIRKNPLSSVAIAAGVGFVLGLLLNRRG